MDLARWRREGIAERLFDYVARQGSRLAYHDQDALNAVLADDIALLDLRWNLQPLMLGRWARAENPAAHARARAARRNPGIIHFTTERKPWKHRTQVRDRRLYFRFLARTAWHGARPPLKGLAQRLEYDLARALLAARIDLYAATAGLDRLTAVAARLVGAAPTRRDPGRAS
jgi:lipopolysaccharide biosynthesis glycosyltransferase